jgi:outer membrane receptor protein involved in Fe transport
VAKDHRWGYFPSIGAAWNIINESFMNKKGIMNDLRLKGSWGYSGNEEIGDFASLGLWAGGTDYDDQAGLAPSQLANPELRWETTRQWNIGLSAGFFKDKLTVALDLYHKYTYDLLLNESLPGKTGLNSITKNSGAVSNKGFELLIGSNKKKKRHFSWRTVFTLSHNTNRIEILKVEEQGGYTMYKLYEGYPLYSFWVWNYLGVDPQTGDAVYEDVDGDGIQTVEDKKIVGNAWPLFEGTVKNVLSYKKWSLDFNFFFKSGNKMFNYTRMFLESGGISGTSRSIQASNLNYWKEENKNNYRAGRDGLLHDVLPRPKSTANADGSFNYEKQSNRFVEDGSFMRLRNVTIGYAFPRFRVYLTASNLLLFTKYSGPDPEVNLESGTLVQGFDFGTPPQPRSVVGGISITF